MRTVDAIILRTSRLAFIASLVIATGMEQVVAVSIPTGPVDFTSLKTTDVGIDSTNTYMVQWRTGTSGQSPVRTSNLTFQYLSSGTNLDLPSRSNPQDNSANNQNDLWSDDAVQITYTKGNNPASAILVYTSNTNGNAGLQTVDGSSTLPLLWKAVTLNQLQAVSGANINGSVVIPSTSPVFIPTEIDNPNGGACPAEGPYGASTRVNNGFCDYSTHFMMNNGANNPLWFANLTGQARTNAFNYASAIGFLGVNTTEQGAGVGTGSAWKPAYLILGTGMANAIPASYSTTINVEIQTQ